MPAPTFTHRMLEAFRTVILCKGVGNAADALGTSQSSISRDLAELQAIVGYQLFVKDGRTVRPTTEALALMTKVQQSFTGLDDIASYSEQLRKQRGGRLSICAIPAIGHSILPEAIAHLRKTFDDVVVTLDINSSVDVGRMVRSRQTDLGFAAQGFAIGEIEAVADFNGNCVCIASHGMLPAKLERVDLEQLNKRPFVALTGALHKRLETVTRGLAIELEIIAEASQSLSVSELVLQGVGIAVVDPFTGVLHRRRGGITLPLRPVLPHSVQALALGDTKLSAPSRELLRYLRVAAAHDGGLEI